MSKTTTANAEGEAGADPPAAAIQLEPPDAPIVEDSPVVDHEPAAIPDSPPHRCPHCDYILSGLTSRRCPECGSAYTVAEARRRAMELDDQPVLRKLRLKDIARIGAGVVAFAIAVTLWLDVMGATSYWAYWIFAHLMFSFIFSLCARYLLQLSWPKAIMWTGIGSLAVIGFFRLMV